jgi:hypothetical protein
VSGIIVQRMYAVAIAGTKVVLEEPAARELYDALHAEFGPKADTPSDPTFGWGFHGFDPTQKHEPGPTLQDDIEAMIAKDVVDIDTMAKPVDETVEKVHDAAEPEQEPAEPRRPGRQRKHKNDEDKAVAKWHQLRESYPWETHSKTLTSITWAFNPRPKVDTIREWIRAAGIKVEDAPTQDEILVQARAVKNGAPIKQPPFGYVVADVEMWNASAGLMSDSDIRDLAEGGLARCGLRKVAA